jgi:hypothetical protein
MKVEGYLFLGCALFFGGADVVYWNLSGDPTGTTALALSVALASLTGFYLLFTGRRLPRRPEDDLSGEIEQGTGGWLLQPAQLVAAVPRPVRRAGRGGLRGRLVAVPARRVLHHAQRDRLRVRVLPRGVRALSAAR